MELYQQILAENIGALRIDPQAAKEIVEQLEVFADGTLDIFAREQSISDENRFTVYGFSELGKRMRAMAMLVMIESITAKIKYNQSDGVATWVYVDEMHELWGEEYSLHALEKMWREVRKRGGHLHRHEPESHRCKTEPFHENNGIQFGVYAFA